MSATKGKGRAVSVNSRPFRTLTLSTRAEALLSALSLQTGLPRGRIVDVAIEAIGICEACNGSGVQNGELGEGTETCSVCGGSQVVPCP